MIKLITILFWLFWLVSVFVSAGFPQTPIPIPSPGTGAEWLAYIDSFDDRETWVDTNYDPVTTRMGEAIRPKDVIIQSVLAAAAVIATYGYENIYYDDGSRDIHGLANRGFIDIEGTAPVAFRWMDIFVSNLYAASGGWKKVSTVKKLDGLQEKPAKPKKVKWKKEDGLKEKKEKFKGVRQ